MNISPMNSISFGATIGREARIRKDWNEDKFNVTNKSTIACMDTYDEQVKKLMDQKNAAYRLDCFMSSNEVDALLKQLPEEGIVDLRLSYQENSRDPEDRFGHLSVSYREPGDDIACKIARENEGIELRDANYLARDYNICRPVDEDGNVNKQQILDWMTSLVNFFNSGCKIDK